MRLPAFLTRPASSAGAALPRLRPWCAMADLLRGIVLVGSFLLPFVFARWFATLWPAPDEQDERGSWSPSRW